MSFTTLHCCVRARLVLRVMFEAWRAWTGFPASCWFSGELQVPWGSQENHVQEELVEDVEAWWRAAQSESEEESSDFSGGGWDTPSDLSAASESESSTDSWTEVWSGDTARDSYEVFGPGLPSATWAEIGLSTLEAAFRECGSLGELEIKAVPWGTRDLVRVTFPWHGKKRTLYRDSSGRWQCGFGKQGVDIYDPWRDELAPYD